MSTWGFGWMGSGLSDKDKYAITSWAFSYFMRSSLTLSDAVNEAVRKVKPEKVNKDGSLKLSRSEAPRAAAQGKEYALARFAFVSGDDPQAGAPDSFADGGVLNPNG